jgi:hypothetical protein
MGDVFDLVVFSKALLRFDANLKDGIMIVTPHLFFACQRSGKLIWGAPKRNNGNRS